MSGRGPRKAPPRSDIPPSAVANLVTPVVQQQVRQSDGSPSPERARISVRAAPAAAPAPLPPDVAGIAFAAPVAQPTSAPLIAEPAPPIPMTARSRILARASDPASAPPAWGAALATSGCACADELICQLSQKLAGALDALPVAAAAARAEVSAARAALHAAIDARCDELDALISTSEASKAPALERALRC